MATQAKSRLIRSFELDDTYIFNDTILATLKPEIKHTPFALHGLDSEIRLGKTDWERLGRPKRIKIVIYNIDD